MIRLAYTIPWLSQCEGTFKTRNLPGYTIDTTKSHIQFLIGHYSLILIVKSIFSIGLSTSADHVLFPRQAIHREMQLATRDRNLPA